MNPEHYVNDLAETVKRVRETFVRCRESVPPADADPVEIARWEGAFMALRAILGEELQPLLESWEQGEPRWRSTEVMLARAQGFGDEYALSGTKTEAGGACGRR